MAADTKEDAAGSFDPLRSTLQRVAYRMLGSVADAEDVVQDAFLRWLDTDRQTVREPEAFLRRIVMRLCLDVLKSARRTRETYIGPWLPEPMVEEDSAEVEDVMLPLMLALERLSPLERAAFLLHDVFGSSFEEIAETIGRDAAACRQLASRARTHIRTDRPRFEISREKGLAFAEAFFTASRNGEMADLRSMLTEDVTVYSDGGGKRPASMAPIIGVADVMAFLEFLSGHYTAHGSRLVRFGIINGLPGFITVESGETVQTTALEISDDQIVGIYVVRNPDKLAHIETEPPAGPDSAALH